MRRQVLLPVLAAAALLCGCAQPGRPVALGIETATAQAAPSVSPAGPANTGGTAAATPEPTPAEPPAWSFPLPAEALFAGKTPDGFAAPVLLWPGERRILYRTADGRVLEARWSGATYTHTPVAEQLLEGPDERTVADPASGWLFAGGKAAQAAVMVHLGTSARCSLDGWLGREGKPPALMQDLQAAGGSVLARLAEERGGEPAAPDRWLLADLGRKAAAEIDLSGFAAKHLTAWGEISRPRLALLGPGRLLAVFAVSGGSAGEGAGGLVFELDGEGNVTREAGFAAPADPGSAAALSQGVRFTASQGGRYLVFTREGGGAWLYDVQNNAEMLLADGPAALMYAQWLEDGTLLYALADQRGVTVRKADPEPFAGPSAAPKQK